MVKVPRPQRVKTRLGSEIGFVDAAWWYRHHLRRVLSAVADPRWHTVLAVTPCREGMQSRVWPASCLRVPQGRGDLGRRMARLLNRSRAPTCLIGSDIVGVHRTNIAGAFRVLQRSDVVFGPAQDGGFWLVGARTWPSGAFEAVRWSTPHALADTLGNLRGRRIGIVDTLRDVDTAADLIMTRMAGRDSQMS